MNRFLVCLVLIPCVIAIALKIARIESLLNLVILLLILLGAFFLVPIVTVAYDKWQELRTRRAR